MQLQVEREEDIDRPMQDKIKLRVFGAWWPKRKCYNDEFFCFAWKLKILERMVDLDRV